MDEGSTHSQTEEEIELNLLDSKLRNVLAKQGEQRTYDDLLILKTRVLKMDYMRQVFSRLHPRQIDELCTCMNLEIFQENEYVFHQGEEGDKFYLVLTGSCDVIISQKVGTHVDEDGNIVDDIIDKVVFRCRSGQQFGERALEFDERRAASIRATCITELISVTREAYRKILKSGNDYDMGGGRKANMIRIMSRTRDKRTPSELQEVVDYLSKTIAFFKKFDEQQQLELCRVSEIVNVWGKTCLFKQGTVGEAFYVILSGSVDIIVTNINDDGNPVDTHVGTLNEGESFGERALESETHLRTASIWTSETHTDLLLIGRDDYKRIISILQQDLKKDKIKLIRSTQLLSHLDLSIISDLVRYMEPKVYRLNTVLYTEGESMKSVFFVHKGDCRVERQLHRNDFNTTVTVNNGRMGPGAVLCDKLFLAESYFDEVCMYIQCSIYKFTST
jgi:CRP-like cAMP-binding protein